MTTLTLASLVVGPVEFDRPWWLILIPVLGGASVLMARRSLSGLEGSWRWVSLGVRLVVICLLAGALAEPHSREKSEALAVTGIIDVSESIPREQQQLVGEYFALAGDAEGDAAAEPQDRLGFVTTARDAFVATLPSRLVRRLEQAHQGGLDATDLAAGLRLALAVAPRDAGNRFVLVTDGNQTTGDLLEAAQSARALNIPVDVLPVRFEYENEVMVDRVLSPATAREGETMNVRVVLQASKPTRGRVNLLLNGQAVDLDPSSESVGSVVELREGQTVLQVPVTAISTGPQRFDAVFEGQVEGGRLVGDSLVQNNRGTSVTFVSGEGRVLVLRPEATPQDAAPLLAALEAANIRAEARDGTLAPASLTELNAFDAVVMVNQSAYDYSRKQQEDLRQYVSDTGGGLLMIGGPNAFGAGGWIGSPLEEALPVRLDPPQKRQMPRGALVLTIHSVEMPQGTFYGKKVSEAAVNNLSRLDLVGINEYDWSAGRSRWVYDLQPVGDGTAVKRAINSLTFGDMQDFTESFRISYDALRAAPAGQRHMIVISDGDPSPPPASLLQDYVNAKITVTTVGVYPHSGLDTSNLQNISRFTGGRHYEVSSAEGVAKLPEIFVKEAMTVRRSLIYEAPGAGVSPRLLAGASEALRGIGGVPNVNGYVVTAEREGLALVTATVSGGDASQRDPLLAQWQYGLGRVVTFAGDASTRWGGQWVGWDGYRQFWEQHVRWVMRPTGSANVRVATESRGESTLITVEALDTQGERLSFASFRGRLAKPDGTGEDVTLRQVAPGRYQATVPSEQAGAYVLSLRYAAPDSSVAGGVLEGTVQAAIARPFADEYRVLRDNAAILTQVAELTGGRVLSGDPARDGLWEREGIRMPVSREPLWLLLLTLGTALFVADVGVRRVRLDWAMVRGAVARALGRGRTVQSTQLGGLQRARAEARERIAQRTGDQSGAAPMTPRELERAAREDAARAADVAKRKFEASPEQLRRGAPGPAPMVGEAPAPQERPKPGAGPAQGTGNDGKGAAKPGQEGLGRLMQAKRKAREGMDEGGDGPRGDERGGGAG